jgi:hypothetical protein
MVRSWVADGGHSLQMYRVVAKMLNMQSWIVEKRWYPSFGVGQRANNSW